MKKLKNKLELLKVIFPLLLGTIKFRIKVFWHEIYNRINKPKKVFLCMLGITLFLLFFYFLFLLFFSAPSDFPKGAIVNIAEGSSLRSVSLKLKQEHIIRSRTLFEAFVILYGGEKHVIPADYLFEAKASVSEVARRISKGERHLAPVKVTIPEGFNSTQIAAAFALRLANFNKTKFLLLAEDLEGYLFPDTYFFLTTDGEGEVIKSMSENFEKKIKPLRPDILASGKTTGKTEREIIIMASIVEGEAKGDSDRAFISGILWKRLAIGMLLQADAAPLTYKAKGLPMRPIGNPGLKAINAAIHPKLSNYLYYLHDRDGNIHFARTFSEHRANILKYLRKN